MIEKIRIRKFRCLRDFEVRLGPLNFLVGANNTGKSSVLDALHLLSECLSKPVGSVLNPDKYSRLRCFQAPAHEPICYSVEVRKGELSHAATEADWPHAALVQSAARAQYSVALRHLPHDQVETDGETVHLSTAQDELLATFERPADKPATVAMVSPQHGREFLHMRRFFQTEGSLLYQLRWNGYGVVEWVRRAMLTTAKFALFPAAIRQPCKLEQNPNLRSDGQGLAAVLYSIACVRPQRFQQIKEILCRLIPAVADVTLPPAGELGMVTILFHETNGAKVYASEASDGLLLFLAILAIAYGHEEEVGVVLLEEPENGVHPQRLRDIVRLLRAISRGELGLPPVQVVVTSHSPYLLDWCQKDEVIVFGRGPDGNVHAKRLDELPDIDERLRDYESLGAYVYEIAEPACESPS